MLTREVLEVYLMRGVGIYTWPEVEKYSINSIWLRKTSKKKHLEEVNRIIQIEVIAKDFGNETNFMGKEGCSEVNLWRRSLVWEKLRQIIGVDGFILKVSYNSEMI